MAVCNAVVSAPSWVTSACGAAVQIAEVGAAAAGGGVGLGQAEVLRCQRAGGAEQVAQRLRHSQQVGEPDRAGGSPVVA